METRKMASDDHGSCILADPMDPVRMGEDVQVGDQHQALVLLVLRVATLGVDFAFGRLL